MSTMKTWQSKQLIKRLEQEPGCFEPITAFRLAQESNSETEITSHIGVAIAVHPVSKVCHWIDGRATLRTTFAALSGPLGSLPPAYNETMMHEARNRAHAFSTFIDIFNARLAALFTDACEKYRLARLLHWHPRQNNSFIEALLSLAGFGTAYVIEESLVCQDVLLRYCGFWAARARNAVNLAAMLQDYCGLPVSIEQFRPRWLAITEAEQSQLGLANVRLGHNSIAGSAILDQNSCFRIVIGPVNYTEYLTLYPGSGCLHELCAITQLFAGDGLAFDVQIILKKEDMPFSRLGSGETSRLGWNLWARTAPAVEDSTQTIITSNAALLTESSPWQ